MEVELMLNDVTLILGWINKISNKKNNSFFVWKRDNIWRSFFCWSENIWNLSKQNTLITWLWFLSASIIHFVNGKYVYRKYYIMEYGQLTTPAAQNGKAGYTLFKSATTQLRSSALSSLYKTNVYFCSSFINSNIYLFLSPYLTNKNVVSISLIWQIIMLVMRRKLMWKKVKNYRLELCDP